jgi:hypothetical protein
MPRRFLPLLAVLLALTACGSPAVATPSLTPEHLVRQAALQLDSTPLHYIVDANVSFDTSELRHVAGFDLAQLQPFTVSGDGEAENAARSRVILHGDGHTVTVVSYDGSSWASPDGTRFLPIGSAAQVTGGLSTSSSVLDQFVSSIAGATDAGSSIEGGAVLDHLHLDLDPTTFGGPYTATYAQAFAASAASPAGGCGCHLPASFATVVAGATYYKTGSVDVFLHHGGGHVVRVVTDLGIALDFDRMAQEVGASCACQMGLPTGSMITRMRITSSFTEGGARVSVDPPRAADPSAPAPHAESGGVAGFTV